MKKLQKIVLILLLIFLPSQLGLHFWPDWSFVNGIRVDYFSPTLYFTDILIILLFILSLRVKRSNLLTIFRRLPRQSLRSFLAMTGVFLFVIFNVYFSLSPFVSIYKWLKVAEFGFLIWYFHNLKFKIENLKFLVIPLIYESILAIWQFVNQSSVGGLWYFLGERAFNSGTPGIANAVFNGQMWLRPYGTFSHPNVLTGFLIVGGLIVLKFIPHISRKITALIFGLVVLVLFLTPSWGNLVSGLNIRQQFNTVAINEWVKSPILGTGLGTSPLYVTGVKNYALVHQPTHNIYLMLLAETGLVGLFLFLFLIYKKFSHLILVVLFIGLFDHYFLTLQQGQLLFSLVLGLTFFKPGLKSQT